MSMLAPSPQQRRLAGQVAWERGRKINWSAITNSSQLSVIIDRMKAELSPLPATEAQVNAYGKVLAACVERVEGFDAEAYAEVPTDRTSANIALFNMRKELSKVERNVTRSADLGDFLEVTDDSSPAAVAEATTTGDDVPF